MTKLVKKKVIVSIISIVLVIALIATFILLSLNTHGDSIEKEESSSGIDVDISVKDPLSGDAEISGAAEDNGLNGSVNTGTEKPDTESSAAVSGSFQTGTKTPPASNDTVSAGNGSQSGSNPKAPNSTGGGVVSVEPVEREGEPTGTSGNTPKATDWVSISPDVPAALYDYNYTVIDPADLLTGRQLEYRGFRDWGKAAEAAEGALTTYYTVDYRNIGSTNPNDKAPYLKRLVYWVGESAQQDICSYMQSVKDHKIISSASVITDGSLIYNNGVRLIRARVYVTFESGAAFYGLQNGLKYYKDVEVAVYASTGEDRYGYGQSADYNALLFSDQCFNTLCDFKKA